MKVVQLLLHRWQQFEAMVIFILYGIDFELCHLGLGLLEVLLACQKSLSTAVVIATF